MLISSSLAQTVEAAAVAPPHGTGSFPPFDSTYYGSHVFWLMVSFGLFYVVMARLVLPRIGGVIEMRRDRIAADLDQASRMKEESDAVMAAYEKALAEARSRAAAIARMAADEIKAKVDAERAATEAALDKKLVGSETRIAAIRDKAMKDVGAIAEETAGELVEKLVGKLVDKTVVYHAMQSLRSETRLNEEQR